LASREQLHVLNSAILNDGSRRALLATLDGRIAPQTPIVQFEPALDRAIDRCVGLGLLEYMASGRLKVSDLGASVVQALDADADLFTRERELLEQLPKNLTQTAIRNALAQRRSS